MSMNLEKAFCGGDFELGGSGSFFPSSRGDLNECLHFISPKKIFNSSLNRGMVFENNM